ncbi:vWA domain-containing protein [Taklimakanibacter deserti]|uniref:vWA domain-containing protein n=1 Tax=Taklimakanibacter deserti TaxID=2267839 RepID=UPI000E647FDD
MLSSNFRTWLKAQSGLAGLRSDDKANVAPLTALCAIPLVMIAGVAIDSSRLSSARVEVQAAVDAAALNAAAAYGTGSDGYVAIADASFDQNVAQNDVLAKANIVTDVKVNKDDNTLTMTASGNIPTTLTRIAGFTQMPLGSDGAASTVSSTVTLPVFSDYHKGQIILVMDYSSSMTEYVGGERKYKTMRDEAVKLVKNLSQNYTNPDVEFGLVPFSHAVRVTMPNNFYYGKTGTSQSTYCIDDRNYPNNLKTDTPDTSTKNNSTKFFTTSCSYFQDNKLKVRPLSTDHSATATQISEMVPYGNTHIALGMETAWHVLTPNAPYEAPQNAEETLKAIVLLTDGKQTSPGNGPNNILSVAQAEANLESLCTAIKDAGIRVVTVSFDLNDEDNADTETRLHDCASDNLEKKVAAGEPQPKYYFNADTNEELATAFGIIRDSIARNMYISK